MAGLRLWDIGRQVWVPVEHIAVSDGLIYTITLDAGFFPTRGGVVAEMRSHGILEHDSAILEFDDGATLVLKRLTDSNVLTPGEAAVSFDMEYQAIG